MDKGDNTGDKTESPTEKGEIVHGMGMRNREIHQILLRTENRETLESGGFSKGLEKLSTELYTILWTMWITQSQAEPSCGFRGNTGGGKAELNKQGGKTGDKGVCGDDTFLPIKWLYPSGDKIVDDFFPGPDRVGFPCLPGRMEAPWSVRELRNGTVRNAPQFAENPLSNDQRYLTKILRMTYNSKDVRILFHRIQG